MLEPKALVKTIELIDCWLVINGRHLHFFAVAVVVVVEAVVELRYASLREENNFVKKIVFFKLLNTTYPSFDVVASFDGTVDETVAVYVIAVVAKIEKIQIVSFFLT